MVYFVFIYGGPTENPKRRIGFISFIAFLLFYIVFMQFLYTTGSYYESWGVSFSTNVWNMLSFIPNVISAVFIVQKTDIDNAKYIRRIFICISVVVSIVTIFYLLNNYSILKITATGHSEYIPFAMDFAITYSLAVIFPLILYGIKVSENKVISIVFTVIIALALVFSSFFLAILSMALGIAVYFILNIKNKYVRYGLLIAVLVVVINFAATEIAEKLLLDLADIIPMEEVSKRIKQLVVYAHTGIANDTTARFTLYQSALLLISKHPITGNLLWNENTILSEHSTILDIWGGCGIFVLGLFIAFMCSAFKYNYNTITDTKSNQSAKAAVIASSVSLIFIALFNPILASPNIIAFWILAPMMFKSEER